MVNGMKAVVVYESLWGNTAAVAHAIADGIGPDTRAVTTDAASGDMIAGADLIVAGAPVLAFSLPTDAMRDSVAKSEADAPTPPDLAHPSMRSWLDSLPAYRVVAKAHKFVVKDKYGPLREGEVERAREWGAELARAAAG
jgi:hypothetical protein